MSSPSSTSNISTDVTNTPALPLQPADQGESNLDVLPAAADSPRLRAPPAASSSTLPPSPAVTTPGPEVELKTLRPARSIVWKDRPVSELLEQEHSPVSPQTVHSLTSIAMRAKTHNDSKPARAKPSKQDAKPQGWYINPYSNFRTRWDLLLSVVLIYNGFVIPLRLAFDMTDDLSSPLFWLDRMVDSLFLLDILLNFRTGVIVNGGHVSYERLAARYIRSWLVVDLVSAAPYELIFLAMEGELPSSSQALQAPKLLRTARVFKALKFLKLFRLLRLKHIFSRWEKALFIKHSISSVIKFFSAMLFLSHWVACTFYAIGAASTGLSWVSLQPLAKDDAFNFYVASFYWSLSTITTIGYGDISAENSNERLFSVLAMVIGSSMYAYGITNIITLVANMNQERTRFREQMDKLNSYMKFRDLPRNLQADIRNFFYERSGTDNWHLLLQHERSILNELSPLLRTRVALQVNERVIMSIPFFRECSPRFVMEIIMNLTPEYYGPSEIVVQEGEMADRMYLVVQGTVDIIKSHKYKLGNVKSGDYFGALPLAFPPDQATRESTVRTATYCDLRSLSYAALNETMQRYPDMQDRVIDSFTACMRARVRTLRRRVRKRKASEASVKRTLSAASTHFLSGTVAEYYEGTVGRRFVPESTLEIWTSENESGELSSSDSRSTSESLLVDYMVDTGWSDSEGGYEVPAEQEVAPELDPLTSAVAPSGARSPAVIAAARPSLSIPASSPLAGGAERSRAAPASGSNRALPVGRAPQASSAKRRLARNASVRSLAGSSPSMKPTFGMWQSLVDEVPHLELGSPTVPSLNSSHLNMSVGAADVTGTPAFHPARVAQPRMSYDQPSAMGSILAPPPLRGTRSRSFHPGLSIHDEMAGMQPPRAASGRAAASSAAVMASTIARLSAAMQNMQQQLAELHQAAHEPAARG